MTDDETGLTVARPGIRDAQAAAVLGALSPTARRILTAARRVLERDGYDGLTLRRVAAEAGETKSLILYHFENKAGLVATLVDSLWHDADVALVEEVERLGTDPRARLRALVDLHHRLAVDTALSRTFFDVLPLVLRDDAARARMARTYRSYRRIGESCLTSDVVPGERALPLATLLLALGEGLAAQTLVTGDKEAVAAAFATLEARVARLMGLTATPRPAPVQPSAATANPDAAAALQPLLAVPDPTAGLSPAAARVLRTAADLVRERGLRALTVDALARASGEPSSSVLYYFGGKHGLVASVLATIDHGIAGALTREARTVFASGQGPAALVDAQSRVLGRSTWMRTYFDVLPVIFRDEALREREAEFRAIVRDSADAFLRGAGVSTVESRSLANVVLALTHGLAIQRLVDKRGAPIESTLDVLRSLLVQEPSSNA